MSKFEAPIAGVAIYHSCLGFLWVFRHWVFSHCHRLLDNLALLIHKTAVFSRIGHLVLIVALLAATGAHWTALQSIAWARMLADNARVAPLSEAIEKTFDGKHPCALCQSIAKGRQSEKKSDSQLEIKKLEFLRCSSEFAFVAPAHFILLPNKSAAWPLLTESPPVPPPRQIFV